MLLLGVSILIIGIMLGTYSFATYQETKNLEQKSILKLLMIIMNLHQKKNITNIFLLLIFLTKKLDKNKDIPIKKFLLHIFRLCST